MRTTLLSLALAIIGLAGTAQAQEVTDQQDIVVQGQKAIPPKQAQRFVRQVVSSVEGQLARFGEPVCPAVIGLPDQYATVVEKRIRRVASEAEIEIGKSGKCQPNLLVIVALDGDALVQQMRKEFNGLFSGLSSAELRRALREGPVHVWNTAEVRNEDGDPVRGPGIDQAGGMQVLQVKSASIIDLPTQQVIVQSTVVLDADALMGKTLTQIADYVAMRTLAGARPPRNDVRVDTILGLFDAGATPPPGVTDFDRSFLSGLYRARATGKSIRQMSSISQQIVRDSKKRAGSPTGD